MADKPKPMPEGWMSVAERAKRWDTAVRIREQDLLAHAKVADQRIAELEHALRQAAFVMNHFGDWMNGADIVEAVEQETGVSNDLIDAAFACVAEALGTTDVNDAVLGVVAEEGKS